jgi:imidazole glycerol phosphate synthase glutamine amidotransferase subunit
MDVVIIDSGGANLASLVYALQRLDAKAVVSDDAAVIRSAPRVLLPGVGSAGNAMARLRAKGLHQVIPQLTQPVLGICLGMQLLFDHSAEGEGPSDGGAGTPCLGLIAGQITRMAATPQLPVPHMGWNQLAVQHDDPLLAVLFRTQLLRCAGHLHAGRDRLWRAVHVHLFAAQFPRRAVSSRAFRRPWCPSARQLSDPGLICN